MLAFERLNFIADPCFETCERLVARGKDAHLNEQRSDVGDGATLREGVKNGVVRRTLSFRESPEHRPDLGGANPGEDASGAVRSEQVVPELQEITAMTLGGVPERLVEVIG